MINWVESSWELIPELEVREIAIRKQGGKEGR